MFPELEVGRRYVHCGRSDEGRGEDDEQQKTRQLHFIHFHFIRLPMDQFQSLDRYAPWDGPLDQIFDDTLCPCDLPFASLR